MRTQIEQLNEQKSQLENNVSGADSNWNDEVKEAFFARHVEPLRQDFSKQMNAMEQVAAFMEQAEREIESLMY